MKDKRTVSLDILRIISALSVILLHVCGVVIYAHPISDVNFKIANFIDSISRFGVPVFVMISGAIFLDEGKDLDVKKLWCKNILRLIVAYFFWGYLYYVSDNIIAGFKGIFTRSLSETLHGIMAADAYLWFILMIAVIYALIPVIRKWTDSASKKDLEYFLALFFLFTVVQSSVVIMADSYILGEINTKFYLGDKIGYFGYFVLGHYLYKYPPAAKVKRILYATLPFDIALNYLSSAYMTGKRDAYHPGIYDSFGIFTVLEIAALFVFVNDICCTKKTADKPHPVLKEVASCTFGIYLMHELLLKYVNKFIGFWGTGADFALIVPVTIGLFAVCFAVTFLLRRIPLLSKYIC